MVYLQLLGTAAGRCLGDLLQLLDSFAEVGDPLDHRHGGGDRVAAPVVRQNTCRKIYTRAQGEIQQEM